MASRRSIKRVPTFTERQIVLADLCARDLWEGTNFENGKDMEISEEQFLIDFAVPFYHLVQNPSSQNGITEYTIRQLIRVANLKALYRSTIPTDFPAGIACITNDVIPLYKDWLVKVGNFISVSYGVKAVLILGTRFVTPIAVPTRNGNYRVPLATRILFFAIPEMPFFNFSNELGKQMQFQSRPQAAISHFMDELNEGMKKNSALINLELPASKLLSTDLIKKIKAGNWWQRRVLDLALLLHFGVAAARPELQKQANQIIAQRAATKTK